MFLYLIAGQFVWNFLLVDYWNLNDNSRECAAAYSQTESLD